MGLLSRLNSPGDAVRLVTKLITKWLSAGSQGSCAVQNTVLWRARLTDKDLPRETHWMTGGALMATYYPISYHGEFVWTICASAEHLEKVGLEVNQGPSRSQESKENQSPAQHAQHSSSNGQQQAPAAQSASVSPKEVRCSCSTLVLAAADSLHVFCATCGCVIAGSKAC